MNESREKIRGSVKQNYGLLNKTMMSILPGQISFFIILSIIPMLSIFVMIISKLSFNYSYITELLINHLPRGASDVIISILEQQKVGVIDILFIITAFYIASKATHSIIIASTQIYNGKQENFFRTRIKAILMLIILIFLVISLISVFTIGSNLVHYLCNVSGKISPIILTLYNILKWPFGLFTIFFIVKVIYTIAPNNKIPSKSVNKGAMVTTLGWTISTIIFSFYITNFANYTKFYGNLSNIIILMIWIYWLSYIFVYGMSINEYKLNKSDEN